MESRCCEELNCKYNEENYCSFRKAPEDPGDDEIHTWGSSGRETPDDIFYISWSNGSRRKGERKRRGKEIINVRVVGWVKNIELRLERCMEVRGEFFCFFLVGSGPRTVSSPQGIGDGMKSEQPFSGCP